MATTTAGAFNEFVNKISLTGAQSTIVSGRRSTTHSYLAASFGANSDMPLVRTSLIGSADRGTMIRPLDDIDVLAVFSNAGGAYDKYRWDSKQFLYRVRQALAGYQIQTVGARGQAVRLFYQNEPHVDIAPVFSYGAGGGYALPAGDGSWITTDPDSHKQWFNERNQALNYHLKPFVKILKRWNRLHSSYLKSFHLEVIAANFFSSMGSNCRDALRLFFERAALHIDVSDPAPHGGSLSGYLTYTNRQQLASRFSTAHARAVNAIAAENRGDQAESIRLWRLELGDEFPAYG